MLGDTFVSQCVSLPIFRVKVSELAPTINMATKEQNMNNVEIISVSAAIASLVLAVIAIWLSIVFFRMSSDLSEKTTEAARGISASVERLEKLFDKLYADTFSMMRDTVSDMRKHIWPEDKTASDELGEEVEKRADEKVDALKESMEREVGQMLQRQRLTDDKVAAVRAEMRELLDRAITGSRQVEIEAREETLRENLVDMLRYLGRRRSRITAVDVVNRFQDRFPPGRIVDELVKMKQEGLVSLSQEPVGPDTVVKLLR